MHNDIVDGETKSRRVRHIGFALSVSVECDFVTVCLYQLPRLVFEFARYQPRLHHLAQNTDMPREAFAAFAQNRYFLLCLCDHVSLSAARILLSIPPTPASPSISGTTRPRPLSNSTCGRTSVLVHASRRRIASSVSSLRARKSKRLTAESSEITRLII